MAVKLLNLNHSIFFTRAFSLWILNFFYFRKFSFLIVPVQFINIFFLLIFFQTKKKKFPLITHTHISGEFSLVPRKEKQNRIVNWMIFFQYFCFSQNILEFGVNINSVNIIIWNMKAEWGRKMKFAIFTFQNWWNSSKKKYSNSILQQPKKSDDVWYFSLNYYYYYFHFFLFAKVIMMCFDVLLWMMRGIK